MVLESIQIPPSRKGGSRLRAHLAVAIGRQVERLWVIAAAGLLLTVFPLLPAPAHAQDEKVTLEIKPSQVRLSPDSTGDVLAILSNGTTKPITNVRLTAIIGSSVEADPKMVARDSIGAGAAIAEKFTLTPSGLDNLPTTGLVRADFVKRRADEGNNMESVVVTSFDIQLQEATALEKLVEVDLLSAGAVLDEFGDTTLAVKVSNLSNSPITVTGMEPSGRGIYFEPHALANALVLRPNHQTSIDLVMTLKRHQPVRAGDHLVEVKVDLRWGPEGAERTASVITSQTIKSAVFGEYDGPCPAYLEDLVTGNSEFTVYDAKSGSS